MSELHNTNPLNYMQSSGVAKVLIFGGGGGLDNGVTEGKTRMRIFLFVI